MPFQLPRHYVRALRWHLAAFGHAPDGRLFFVPIYGNKPVSKWSYANAWRRARQAALTPAQQRSPLAAQPYDLRHAAVSLRLNAGVPATQVAGWAGHSVHVVLKVYAKCIDGQNQAARRRIENALRLRRVRGLIGRGALRAHCRLERIRLSAAPRERRVRMCPADLDDAQVGGAQTGWRRRMGVEPAWPSSAPHRAEDRGGGSTLDPPGR